MSKLLRNKFNAILIEQNYEKNEKFWTSKKNVQVKKS